MDTFPPAADHDLPPAAWRGSAALAALRPHYRPPPPGSDPLTVVLDLARWAPSGDNVQPWRFRRTGALEVEVAIRDQRGECLYERDGRCQLLAAGALLETLRLAATTVGHRAEAAVRPDSPGRAPVIDVRLVPSAASAAPDPLARWIRLRAVHRGCYRDRALGEDEKRMLAAAVGRRYELRWSEGGRRERVVRLNRDAAHLRYRLPEAWEVHRRIVDWERRFSPDRIPARALGLPRALLGVARRQMATWAATDFANRWLGGTRLPCWLLEQRPGLACAAHLALVDRHPEDTTAGGLAAGAAVQRFWLAATGLGLVHQPAMAALIFARYARDGLRFTALPGGAAEAAALGRGLIGLYGPGALESVVWCGRIGEAQPAASRSLRKELAELEVP